MGKGFFTNSKLHGCALALSLGFVLSSCLDTGVKRLGATTTTSTTSVNSSDSFTINLAFRDASQDAGIPIRVVNIQGVSGSTSASFSGICGADGLSCTCQFYTSASDTAPKGTSAVSYSSTNNTLNCTMDPAQIATPSAYNNGYVRLVNLAGTKASGLISIKTSLTIEDVLGTSLTKTNVRKIYKYGCDFTFLEGESFGAASGGSCPTTYQQTLGSITTTYHYYLYAGSGTDFNTNKKGGQTPRSVCGLTIIGKNCQGSNGTSVLQFGLYNQAAGAFTVQVKALPNYTDASEVIGYAAFPDSNNECATGLIKVRPWLATPTSIIPGTAYNPTPVAPNPSSQPATIFTEFLNSNNSLNNQIFNDSATAPTNMIISRQPNSTQCDITGSCAAAVFGTSFDIFSVPYSSQQPILCVFPSGLVSGL